MASLSMLEDTEHVQEKVWNTVRIAIGCLGFLGAALNCFVLHLLKYAKFGSSTSKRLLCNQCIYDTFTCVMILLAKITGLYVLTSNHILNIILCHLWSGDSLFWFGYNLGTNNLIFVSLDRLMAVYSPIKYKTFKQKLLLVCVVYLIFVEVVLYVPVVFYRRFENGTCKWTYATDSDWVPLFYRVYSYISLILSYMFPALLTIIAHFLIVIKILHNRPQGQPLEKPKICRLVLSTVILTILCAVLRLPDAYACVNNITDYVFFVPGEIDHQIGIICVTLCYLVHPGIVLGMIPSLQQLVRENFQQTTQVCRKLFGKLLERHSGGGRGQDDQRSTNHLENNSTK